METRRPDTSAHRWGACGGWGGGRMTSGNVTSLVSAEPLSGSAGRDQGFARPSEERACSSQRALTNGVRVDITEPASIVAARQLAEEAAAVTARKIRRRVRMRPIRPLAAAR